MISPKLNKKMCTNELAYCSRHYIGSLIHDNARCPSLVLILVILNTLPCQQFIHRGNYITLLIYLTFDYFVRDFLTDEKLQHHCENSYRHSFKKIYGNVNRMV